MSDWFIILGAKVKRDGLPSGALVRRVRAALEAAKNSSNPMFLPTGGRGKSGYVEALIMKRMLMDAGMPEDRIVCEEEAHATLDSVRLCTAMLRARSDVDRVIVCTDRYHLPRTRALFHIAGLRTEAAPIQSAKTQVSPFRFMYDVSREVAALPLQCAQFALTRVFGNGGPAA